MVLFRCNAVNEGLNFHHIDRFVACHEKIMERRTSIAVLSGNSKWGDKPMVFRQDSTKRTMNLNALVVAIGGAA